MEAGDDVRDIIFRDGGSFVVQGEAVGLHVVEPNLVGAAVPGLGENEDAGGHPGVGLEDAGGHGDDGFQAVLFHQRLADGFVGLGGPEEHAVRHDAGAAPAGAEHAEKEGQEEQLGLFGLTDLEQVSGDDVRIQAALKGRVGQDEGIGIPIRVLVAEAVPVGDDGIFDTVGHHVHGPDAEHGAIHVVAGEHFGHVVFFGLLVKKDGFPAVGLQILPRRHQEPRRPAGRVTDGIGGLGGHQLDHHADDVPRGAELPVHAGLGDLGEQIFVGIPPHIAAGILGHEAIDLVQPIHHFGQQQRRGQLKNRVIHVLGVGTLLVPVQTLDEGKDQGLDRLVHLLGTDVLELRPAEQIPLDLPLSNFHGPGKDALVGQTQHSSFFGAEAVSVVQVADEHEVGHLLHDIEGVGQAAGPKHLPKAVDLMLQFSCDHGPCTPSLIYKNCTVSDIFLSTQQKVEEKQERHDRGHTVPVKIRYAFCALQAGLTCSSRCKP